MQMLTNSLLCLASGMVTFSLYARNHSETPEELQARIKSVVARATSDAGNQGKLVTDSAHGNQVQVSVNHTLKTRVANVIWKNPKIDGKGLTADSNLEVLCAKIGLETDPQTKGKLYAIKKKGQKKARWQLGEEGKLTEQKGKEYLSSVICQKEEAMVRITAENKKTTVAISDLGPGKRLGSKILAHFAKSKAAVGVYIYHSEEVEGIHAQGVVGDAIGNPYHDRIFGQGVVALYRDSANHQLRAEFLLDRAWVDPSLKERMQKEAPKGSQLTFARRFEVKVPLKHGKAKSSDLSRPRKAAMATYELKMGTLDFVTGEHYDLN